MSQILLVEVDQEVRQLLQTTLEQHGYRVQVQDYAAATGPALSSAAACLVLSRTSAPGPLSANAPAESGRDRRPSLGIALLRAFCTLHV
jgi:DNA-binding NtrC family response regulator